jgi:GAF domain-containing protein
MTALPPDVAADLRRENARLQAELRASRDRLTASAEILRTIGAVSGDAEQSLYQIAETSKRLFEASSVTIFVADGDHWGQIIHDGASSQRIGAEVPVDQLRIGGHSLPAAAFGENRQIHLPDLDHVDPAIADWPGLGPARAAGTRTLSGTPLRSAGRAIGVLTVHRDRLSPFSAEELALLQSFADKAAIAIENARLFNETRETLERQTATADILKVIASSPSDTQPVFDAIATSANRLLGGFSCTVVRFIDGTAHLKAFTPTTPTADEILQSSFPQPVGNFAPFQLAQAGEVTQITDTEALTGGILEISRARGFRSMLFAPLVNKGESIGTIGVTRVQPGAFADHHVQLLKTFADQAVIAIENVRLFNETREALERQTATSEILKVIASSPNDVQPVFDVIVERAVRLCGGRMGRVYRYEDGMIHLVAGHGLSLPGLSKVQEVFPRPAGDDTTSGRAIRSRQPNFVIDIESDASVPPLSRQMIEALGTRSQVTVPMLRSGEPIGAITVGWADPAAYGDQQVELLRTFADQAVIAIENVRLFNETREALERQTATADILKVIASSPSDVQPVFEAIAASANRLIGGFSGAVFRFVEGACHLAAFTKTNPAADEVLKNAFPQPLAHFAPLEMVGNGETVQFADTEASSDFQITIARARGFRSMMFSPLMSGGAVIGMISVTRLEPGSFAAHHVQLLQTFADQAVIAIENVRLFDEVQARTRELSEALTYQTGSANILAVIASSPTDVGPVLKAIAESACKVCEANDAIVHLLVDDELVNSAHHGPIPPRIFRRHVSRDWVTGRAVIEKVPVHVRDVLSPEGDQFAISRTLGNRTILAVPLLRENECIGAISLRRVEVNPFHEKQITQLQTFADQAVIAIGNVRLFDEVQARTEDLRESLQQQTATADVLKVISRSAFDLQTVFETLVQSAAQLCRADRAAILRLSDSRFQMIATHGFSPEFRELMFARGLDVDRGSAVGRAALERRAVQIPDILADPDFTVFESQRHGGFRTVLGVPLLREGNPIGALFLTRGVVELFTQQQIDLVTTFADQAVIAIENARLFEEVQARTRDLSESLQQQTATADVLKVISASPGELQPVFQAMLDNAVRLCEAKFSMLFFYEREENQFRAVGQCNLPPAFSEVLGKKPTRADPMIPLGRVAITKQPVQVPDVLADQAYLEGYPGMVAVAELGGARTLLQVPMLKENELVGSIAIYRQEVRPFTDKQIALVRNFAAQAVIAIENARLLNELRQRTDDLTQSLDDLRTAQDRLVQTEKLASLGQLTAGIAHEIKNPLNFVNNFAALSAELTDELNEVLAPAALDARIREEVNELTHTLKNNLEKVVQHGKRADSIVKNMLLHSREGSGDHRPADINALLDESLNLAYHGARAERREFNVTLQRDFDEMAGQIEVFPQEITRVFLNLISNGFYAVTKRKTENGGLGFEPVLSATTKNLGDTVEIRIRDNGTGIPAEVREKMFNPFFTTKPAGEGTGLGLSMSHDIIVKQHGGRIDVETEPGHFTEFRIVLPRISNFSNKIRG